MKQFQTIFLICAVALFASCSKNDPAELNAETALLKASTSTTPITFMEQNLFPEGVEYDPYNDWFFVSSVTQGDIGIVKRDGSYMPFITDPTLTATTGLQVDKARKRLWVSNSPQGVGAYNMLTGEREFYVNLAQLIPGAPVFINDIAIDPQGNAYITNSAYPVIYKVTRDGTASIFFTDPALTLPAGSFGFNGIEYANQGYLLAAFSATNTIYKIPVSDPQSYDAVTLDATLNGPDGLLISKNGRELVVVSNAGGGQGMVSTFSTNDMWESGSLKSTFNTGMVFPTTATSDGKNVYVLYAYLHLRGTGQSNFTIQPVPMEGNTPF